MIFLLNSSSWVTSSLVIVTLSILLCSGILWIVRKMVATAELKKNHDVVGFTFSIIGVLYSVILGFTVISVQDRYNTVLETIHTEAILLADLYQDASFFPKADGDPIRAALRHYVNHVIQEEWWTPPILHGGDSLRFGRRESSANPSPEEVAVWKNTAPSSGEGFAGFDVAKTQRITAAQYSKKINLKSRALIKDIWTSYYTISLNSEKISIWYTESISKLNSLLNARLARQFNSQEHLGCMMWTLLVTGAVITICFMFFFGLENFQSHMLMTALLAGYLSFMLFLVYSLDNVIKGPQGIKPTALEQVYTLFDELDQDSLTAKSFRCSSGIR